MEVQFSSKNVLFFCQPLVLGRERKVEVQSAFLSEDVQHFKRAFSSLIPVVNDIKGGSTALCKSNENEFHFLLFEISPNF